MGPHAHRNGAVNPTMGSLKIKDTGFSAVYEPEGGKPPLASIIFVHGLQGHPYRTWTHTSESTSPPNQSQQTTPKRRYLMQTLMTKLIPTRGKTATEEQAVFWPVDLLLQSDPCSQCQILVWGYKSGIASTGAAVNKNTIFSHAKNFVFDLDRQDFGQRPIIFVAHSLGGLILKEALAICDTSDDVSLQRIVDQTWATMFLGTPHRGGGEYANIGEVARHIASACMLDTNPALLDSLNLRNADLERSQENFSRTWRKHNFKVKTFQEDSPLTGAHIPGTFLNKLVVPNYSSTIGDDRERAETLSANHRNMCKYGSVDDPNFVKVGGELSRICRSIQAATAETEKLDLKGLQRSLAFQDMDSRFNNIVQPMDQTCTWVLQREEYKKWCHADPDSYDGLLWIKGKPGSGKSTLMKYLQSTMKQQTQDMIMGYFYFKAHGTTLEKSFSGLLRSLVLQVIPHFPTHILQTRWKEATDLGLDTKYSDEELKSYLDSVLRSPAASEKHVFFFVDGVDECQGSGGRETINFLGSLVTLSSSAGNHLRVCVASQKSLAVGNTPHLVIDMDSSNFNDIAKYVCQRFPDVGMIPSDEKASWEFLEKQIVRKANGFFLGVVLMVNMVLIKVGDGENVLALANKLDNADELDNANKWNTEPESLDVLCKRVLQGSDTQKATRLFQWVLCSARLLRVSELSSILGFVIDPSEKAMATWTESPEFPKDHQHVENLVRSLSHGLLEVKTIDTPIQSGDSGAQVPSMMVGTGSFNAVDDYKVIDFIHDSIRDFFVAGHGFQALGARQESLQEGHIFLMNCCITYALFSSEMDHFYDSRIEADTASYAVSLSTGGQEIPDTTPGPSNEDKNNPSSQKAPTQRSNWAAVIDALRNTPVVMPLRMTQRVGVKKGVTSFSHAEYDCTRYERARYVPAPARSRGVRREPLYRSISAGTSAASFHGSTYRERVVPLRRLRVEDVALESESYLSRRKVGKWLSETSQSLAAWMTTITSKVKRGVRKSSSSSITQSQTPGTNLDIAFVESPERSIPSMEAQSLRIRHGQSHWPREIPVLLSYVVEMFDQHAASAEDERSDTQNVVERLANPESWKRWLIVRDDLERSTTLLYYAAQRNLCSWVQYLIERDPLWYKQFGGRLNSPLIAAVNQGHLRVVSTFLDHLPSFDLLNTHRDPLGKTILHHAIMSADCLDAIVNNSTIRSLDAESKLIDMTDKYLQTPLHLACGQGSLQVVQTLIQHKANVSLQDNEGLTPLHHACYRPKKDLKIIITLLKAGARLDSPNQDSITPLQLLSDDERLQISEHAKKRIAKRSGNMRRIFRG